MTSSGKNARVVVVGGGFGGATTAKYLRTLDKNIQVTLVEPSQTFYTCPFSNLVLGGRDKYFNPEANAKHSGSIAARKQRFDFDAEKNKVSGEGGE